MKNIEHEHLNNLVLTTDLTTGFSKHLPDALEGPINLLPLDDQRRRNPNHTIMGFFAQDPFFLQRFAVGAGRTVELNSDPQPLAADFLKIGAAELLQQLEKVSAQLGGAFDQLFLHQHPQRGACHGAAQGIAAEGAAVVSGVEDAHDFREESTAETG